MIKLLHTNNSNYNIDELEMDDIVIDTKENVVIIQKQKHPFMSVTDVIDDNSSSNVAMSQKGVQTYIVDTEASYTNAVLALKAENAAILSKLGDLENRIKNLENA